MENKINLSERKKKILSAVISENIKRAEPISSKDLQEQYLNDISSATIRNELMALEELGFLSQPHTSSGRVPTTSGFKMYIEELMPSVMLSKKEINNLKQTFKDKARDLEEIVKKAAKAISEATNYTSIVYTGVADAAVIENIKIIKITDTTALVVIITDLGVIKDVVMRVEADTTDQEFKAASKFASEIFAGKTLGSVDEGDYLIKKEMQRYTKIFDMVIEVIEKREKDFQDNLIIEGRNKLFDYPEYSDISKARNTLSVFEDKKALYPLLSSGGDLEIEIKVGGDDDFKDCSVVTATYKINGKSIGKAGVVGPVRMDYAKVISVLKGVNQAIEESFKDEINDDNNEKRRDW